MEKGLHHEVHGAGVPLLLVRGTGSGHVPTYDDPALVAEVILGGSALP